MDWQVNRIRAEPIDPGSAQDRPLPATVTRRDRSSFYQIWLATTYFIPAVNVFETLNRFLDILT